MTLHNNNDISTFLRVLDSCSLASQFWKAQRGYLLADEVAQDGDNVTLSGFLKGSCINSNQIAHLTGFDDYHIEKIEILAMGSRQRLASNS